MNFGNGSNSVRVLPMEVLQSFIESKYDIKTKVIKNTSGAVPLTAIVRATVEVEDFHFELESEKMPYVLIERNGQDIADKLWDVLYIDVDAELHNGCLTEDGLRSGRFLPIGKKLTEDEKTTLILVHSIIVPA